MRADKRAGVVQSSVRYLIDTDYLIDRLKEESHAVALIDRLADQGVALSIVSYLELFEGVLQATDREAAEHKLDALIEGMPLFPVTRSVAQRCAQIRSSLRDAGRRVNNRALDLIIAATALENGLTLVTRNVADYSDIVELTLYEAG